MKTQDITGIQTGGGGCLRQDTTRERIFKKHFARLFIKRTTYFWSFSIRNAFKISNTANGFTLAEVLITLGIIGIVAAMTIPNIVGDYKKKVVETRLQRFYSVANNALKASEAENESWDFWYFETNDNVINTKKWYDTYLAKYWKTVKVEVLNDGFVVAYFPDGSLCVVKSGFDYFYYPDAKNFSELKFRQRTKYMGQTVFVFSFHPQRSTDGVHYKKGIEPYGTSNSDLYNDSLYGCNATIPAGGAAFCTRVIALNGWKIPDDYPFRF